MHRAIKDRKSELGRQLAIARERAGKTQEEAAGAINVSRATIINFETGKSNPDIFQLEDLVEFYGSDPIHRLRNYRNPALYDLKKPGSDSDAVTDALCDIIRSEMSDTVRRQLLFLLVGDHGRDPDAIAQEMTAILQIPLKMGHSIAVMVHSLYTMCIAHGDINCPDAVQPDMEYWESAILAGYYAAKDGQSGYSVK